MEASIHRSPDSEDIGVLVRVDNSMLLSRALSEAVLSEVARLVAERIVEEKYQEILALIDPQAIANLSIAEAAAAIYKSLQEKTSGGFSRVETRVQREVYQRGVFGGVTRIA